MSNSMRFAALLFAFVACALPATKARAWVDHTQSFAAVKAATPPSSDPSLSDPEWKTGLTLVDFFNYTTREPAKRATIAYILYDAKYMYVAVHSDQAGIPITAAQTVDHAGVATDDHISLNLETSGSGARVYQFRVNPKGIHDEYSSENSRYAPDWSSYATVLPNGDYNVVMVIPLKVIRGQKSPVQSWRINVVRYMAATNDSYTWAYEPSMTAVGNAQNWPLLTGLQIAADATKPRPHADIYGLASAGSQHNYFQNGIGNFEQTASRPAGVDLTIPFTNTLAFVGTINPDFSNIEQDQTTIAPQEFQRQYNEYRPFFSQGANYVNNIPGVNINTYNTLFYTPSIGIFNQGLKVEGTTGESAVGALNVTGDGFNDTAFGYGFAVPDGSLEFNFDGVQANHTGVRDDSYAFGVGGTNPHSGFFGVGDFETDRGTLVTNPAQGNFISIGAGVQNARELIAADYRDIGPEFDPIDGYTQINDVLGPQFFAQYNGVGSKNGPIQSYQLTGGLDRLVDRSGAAHEADEFGGASVVLKNLFGFSYNDSSSELASYQDAYPFYFGRQVLAYNAQSVNVNYKSSSPTPSMFGYAWGPFGGLYTQQLDGMTTQVRGPYTFTFEYGGNVVRQMPGVIGYLPNGLLAPALDSQWLRRFSLTRSFGKNASLAVLVRSINGDGGYAVPGTDIAVSYHARFANANELYVVYGTPAYYQTLDRLLVKYIFHLGGSTGT